MKYLATLFLLLLLVQLSFSQKDVESVKKDLRQDEIKSHMYFLASDELEGRDTPSEGLDKAAAYLSEELKKFGVKTLPDQQSYFQKVALRNRIAPKTIEIKFGETKITGDSKAYLFDGNKISTKADFIVLDYGLESEFQANNVSGKVVVSKAGDGKTQNPREYYFLSIQKSKWAKEAGAKALIEIFPDIPFSIVAHISRDRMEIDDEETISSTGFQHILLDTQKEKIDEFLQFKGTVEVNVVGDEDEIFYTNNVVGYVQGTDKKLRDEYVVCTAHYDHLGIGKPDATGDSIYNGARDNAVGVTSLLISAKNVAKNPLKRSVLFVFFTGEEKGLLGSEWFMTHPPIKPESMVYCLNNDNGSYTDTTIVSIPGLSKINTEEPIKEACAEFGLTATDDFPEADMLYSASDNISFSQIGIPSVTYSLGFTSFNAEVRKYYHQPNDEAESINYNYLYKFCGGYNLSLRFIGNMTDQPFWITEDNFYEAGQKLYNK